MDPFTVLEQPVWYRTPELHYWASGDEHCSRMSFCRNTRFIDRAPTHVIPVNPTGRIYFSYWVAGPCETWMDDFNTCRGHRRNCRNEEHYDDE